MGKALEPIVAVRNKAGRRLDPAGKQGCAAGRTGTRNCFARVVGKIDDNRILLRALAILGHDQLVVIRAGPVHQREICGADGKENV